MTKPKPAPRATFASFDEWLHAARTTYPSCFETRIWEDTYWRREFEARTDPKEALWKYLINA